ncbi:MAG: tyrosine-type recombinase/integrase [Acidobacteriota bacterium]|nr:tyrosine-type recombinase/integrase [Acidobacteriota bacterium]
MQDSVRAVDRRRLDGYDLRHTCLTNLLQQGVDLATVRDWAGHHSITETSKYVHATAESRRRAAAVSTGLVQLATGALASEKVSTIDAKGATSCNSVQKPWQAKTNKNPKKKAE